MSAREKRPALSRLDSGFTLMEVMAAIFLTSIVITFAVSFYIDIAKPRVSSLGSRVISRTPLSSSSRKKMTPSPIHGSSWRIAAMLSMARI